MNRTEINKNSYTFTEGLQAKEQAGTIVDRLVKTFTTINPDVSYENAMKVILELPSNKKLAETYYRDSNTLI